MAKLHTLVDNFNDDSIHTGLWPTVSAGVTETGGRLVLTPSTVGVFPTANTLPTTYDLTDSHIVAYVPVVPANGTTGTLDAGMAIRLDGSNRIVIRKISTQLGATTVVGGTSTDVVNITWDATAHSWWRLRETSGTFYIETSANGTVWTVRYSVATPFTMTAVNAYIYTGWSSGTESSPGTLQVETVNPTLLQDAAGNPAAPFSAQSVTNNTPAPHALTASGTGTTTGSAAVLIPVIHAISASGTGTTTGSASVAIAGSALRDLAGNLAPAFTDQPVTNNTTTTTHPISAAGTGVTTGTASLRRVLFITASGFTGRGVLYDDEVTYDAGISYDPHPTGGDASLTIIPAGETPIITASGTGTTTGSAALSVIPVGGISATGFGTTSGSATLIIPVVHISASGVSATIGSAELLVDRFIYAAGQTVSTGSASLSLIGSFWLFEPPIAYDNPPFHADTRGRTLIYARHRPSQPRGRTVLKNGDTYTLIDSPTVDQINAADMAYLGGHVYTVDPEEAQRLLAAGFVVTGVSS